MKAEFSQYSYGIALAQELLHVEVPEISVLPLFPGWPGAEEAAVDTHVPAAGWPVFLHLSPVEYMLTPRAKGWSAHEQRFFRLRVQQGAPSSLHNLLRCLSHKEPEVYYVAPAFHRLNEFARLLDAHQIVQQSRFIPLQLLPDTCTCGAHFITYRRGEDGLDWHAGSVQHVDLAISGSDWLVHLRERLEQQRLLGWRFLLDLRQCLLNCLQHTTAQPRLFDELGIDPADLAPLRVLRDVRLVLRTQFSVEVFVLRGD